MMLRRGALGHSGVLAAIAAALLFGSLAVSYVPGAALRRCLPCGDQFNPLPNIALRQHFWSPIKANDATILLFYIIISSVPVWIPDKPI